jgi:uncharacterized membrane protein
MLRSSIVLVAVCAAVLAAPAPSARAQAGAAPSPAGVERFVGNLPCADCVGIRSELWLGPVGADGLGHFRLRDTYLATRNGDQVFESSGQYRLIKGDARASGVAAVDRIRLILGSEQDRRSYARLSPSALEMLDRSEQRIASKLDYKLLLAAPDTRTPAELAPRQLYAGTLSARADQWWLAPCGGGPAVRLRDVSPEVMITAVLGDLGFGRRVPSIYLEAFGRPYEQGQVAIDRLNRAGIEMGCPQARPLWQAQGNEPFWTLSGTTANTTLTRLGMPTITVPPAQFSWTWRDGRTDRAEALVNVRTEGRWLAARFTPRICRDTMADAAFGWTAEFRLDGKVYAGCAFLGTESLP